MPSQQQISTTPAGIRDDSSVYVFDPALRGAPCRRWWVMRDEIKGRFE